MQQTMADAGETNISFHFYFFIIFVLNFESATFHTLHVCRAAPTPGYVLSFIKQTETIMKSFILSSVFGVRCDCWRIHNW